MRGGQHINYRKKPDEIRQGGRLGHTICPSPKFPASETKGEIKKKGKEAESKHHPMTPEPEPTPKSRKLFHCAFITTTVSTSTVRSSPP